MDYPRGHGPGYDASWWLGGWATKSACDSLFPHRRRSPIALVLTSRLGDYPWGDGGYLFALGQYVFVRVGYTAYYETPLVRIPRTQEALILLGLLTTGVVRGKSCGKCVD